MDKISTAPAPSPIEMDSEIGVAVINPIKHISILNNWLNYHGLLPLSESDLPEYGVSIYHNETMVGLGMLYRMEGGRCLIDGAIASPSTPKRIRNACIDAAISGLEWLACDLGFNKVETVLSKNTLKNRFIKHGYSADENSTRYYKELRNVRSI